MGDILIPAVVYIPVSLGAALLVAAAIYQGYIVGQRDAYRHAVRLKREREQ